MPDLFVNYYVLRSEQARSVARKPTLLWLDADPISIEAHDLGPSDCFWLVPGAEPLP